eukprot:Nitzschia sp. Nitz4//scaffold137_size62074//5733//6749//NITZ4_006405-RA/size62074-processed-gene-0.66-mRNA-1//1//CDS//3329535670//6668//frame0
MGAVSGKASRGSRAMATVNTHIGYSRKALHAGSWYSDSPDELNDQLEGFLSDARAESKKQDASLRGVISPHAGYSYSGPTAAFSYLHLANELAKPDSPISRILILHPSHHVYVDGCLVSGGSQLETPVGNLLVDDELRQEILGLKSGGESFGVMKKSVDEREHSGEMQYPYIAKALASCSKLDTVKVLPIMCGGISTEKEAYFGKLLAPIVARPDVLCVISTDFCHWGERFQYQPTSTSTSTASMEIHEVIRQLDHQGMELIELEDPGAFAKYLKQTRNTICGRHAIAVWLHAVHENNPSKEVLDITFVKYDQSSPVRRMRDSSVSYASATATRKVNV